jgi:hypothetical protein
VAAHRDVGGSRGGEKRNRRESAEKSVHHVCPYVACKSGVNVAVARPCRDGIEKKPSKRNRAALLQCCPGSLQPSKLNNFYQNRYWLWGFRLLVLLKIFPPQTRAEPPLARRDYRVPEPYATLCRLSCKNVFGMTIFFTRQTTNANLARKASATTITPRLSC